jgi:signal recognition particle receptor subunit beta
MTAATALAPAPRTRRFVPAPAVPRAKIIVAGGSGAGKTTLVRSVSEIVPLQAETAITRAGAEIDDLNLVSDKHPTTIGMDFGRVAVTEDLDLYLFGTPGQERYRFMWDSLVQGAVGVIVLVDARRLDDCFATIDYLEDRELPYVVGVNRFHGSPSYDLDAVRDALAVGPEVVVFDVDARRRTSTFLAVARLVDVAIGRAA